MADRGHLSIGEVLSLLREEFPNVTISKIRFLESQGLLDPERTPSGYRKFYDEDVERLRWILRQQQENFLPLKVIKGRLGELPDSPPTVELPEALGMTGAQGTGGPRLGSLPGGAEGTEGSNRLRSPGSAGGGGSAGVLPSGGGHAEGVDEAIAGRAAAGRGRPSAASSSEQTVGGRPASTDPGFPGDVGVGGQTESDRSEPATGAAGGNRVRGTGVSRGGSTAGADGDAGWGGATLEPDDGGWRGATNEPGEERWGGTTTGPRDEGWAGAGSGVPTRTGGYGRPDVPDRPGGYGTAGGTRDARDTIAGPTRPGSPTGAPGPTRPGSEGPTRPGSPTGAPGATRPGSPTGAPGPTGSVPTGSGYRGETGPNRGPATFANAGAGARTPAGPPSRGVAGLLGGGGGMSDPGRGDGNYTIDELTEATGLSAGSIDELLRFGLISGRDLGGSMYFDENAYMVAALAAGFARHGIEARHLRMYKNAAERESALFEQIIMPLVKQRNPQARQQAAMALEDLGRLSGDLRAALLRQALGNTF